MLEQTKPEGVITFTSIFDHLKVVEACAPRGIHVMVEKPLAVSVKHALAMSKLAKNHKILLLTNYETSWYPSNYEGYKMTDHGEFGVLRKIIVYDGHKGPREINVNSEFLDWLTDPVLNGGGAVTDFGCYGADLITWILKGEKPLRVFADLKQYKPNVYPKVDDDATIILTYPNMEGVIHASWNWPFNRKDMHIYGTTGYAFIDDAETIRYRLDEKSKEQIKKVPLSAAPFNDPFTFFAKAIKREINISPTDLSSLEINLTVVEILEAARKSSKTGKQIKLKK
jgi:predicted dehydrogenase